MLPSLFASADRARDWSVARAATYGAGIGALAALFKTLGPLRAAASEAAGLWAIAEVAAAFALLCAGAALLRDFLVRRLTG
jgi:hypothetical protein